MKNILISVPNPYQFADCFILTRRCFIVKENQIMSSVTQGYKRHKFQIDQHWCDMTTDVNNSFVKYSLKKIIQYYKNFSCNVIQESLFVYQDFQRFQVCASVSVQCL